MHYKDDFRQLAERVQKMKFFLCVVALLYYNIANSQSIFSDKKDPFTNARIITTGLNTLYKVAFTPILQVQSVLEVRSDSIIAYKLNFSTPGLQMVINNIDSTPNACFIRDEAGIIYKGDLNSELAASVINKSYQVYACTFATNDFYEIINSRVTDVKITVDNGKGGLFAIDKRSQDDISKQAKALLNEFKNYTIK